MEVAVPIAMMIIMNFRSSLTLLWVLFASGIYCRADALPLSLSVSTEKGPPSIRVPANPVPFSQRDWSFGNQKSENSFTVVLHNQTTKILRLSQASSQWYGCLSFDLVIENSKSYHIIRSPRMWHANAIEAIELPANGDYRVSIDFTQGDWEGLPAAFAVSGKNGGTLTIHFAYDGADYKRGETLNLKTRKAEYVSDPIAVYVSPVSASN